jgi:hypothetical protein
MISWKPYLALILAILTATASSSGFAATPGKTILMVT